MSDDIDHDAISKILGSEIVPTRGDPLGAYMKHKGKAVSTPSDELRAAAVRRARLHVLGAWEAYRDYYFSQKSGVSIDDTVQADCVLLADAYVAEHPESDALAITPEWLRSVGWKDIVGDFDEPIMTISMPAGDPENCVPHLVRWSDGSMGVWNWVWVGRNNKDAFHENREWQPTAVGVPSPKTRGDVRLLCRALGVTLKD